MFTIYANDQLVYEPGDQELLVLQPKLVLEMGAAGSLEFSVPPGHPYYNNFNQLSTVVYAKFDNTEVFRGRVLSSSRDFYNFRQTYCEGALSYLVDSVQKGEAYQGSAHGLFRQIISNHNRLVDSAKQFTVGNITVPDKDIKIAGKSTGTEEDPDAYAADYWRQIYIDSVADNWSTSLDYINTCLIDYLGGYLMVRRVGNTNYIDWVQEYATTATQEIEFGTNLLDMTEEISADDLFTVLIPIGDENLTIASVNGGSIEIVDSNLVNKYGRIVRTEVFGNVNQASTLLENGRNYLAKESSAPITFTIKAVDLSMIDSGITAIRLGDRVKIKSEPHNINQYYTCTKIEYDLEKPENTVFTFGNPHQSLTQRYRRDKRKEQERANYSGYSGAGGLGNSIANPTTGDTKKKLDDFFDAWINVSPEQGKVNLGAVYEDWEKGKKVLENNVGINLDAPDGTINIFADHTQYQNDRATFSNNLGINLDAPNGTIDIFADHTQLNDTSDDLAQTKINLRADIVDVQGRLQAVEAIFGTVTAEQATITRGVASGTYFYAPKFIVADLTGSGTEIDLASHKHDLYCDANGNVTMGRPCAPEAAKGFNIADTPFHQAAVSDVVLTGLVGTSYDNGDDVLSAVLGSSNVLYANGNIYGCFTTTLKNGNTKTIRVGLPDKSVTDVTYVAGTNYSKINVNFSNGTSEQETLPTIYNSTIGDYQTLYNYAYDAGQRSKYVTNVSYVGGTGYSQIKLTYSDGTSENMNLPMIYNSDTGDYQTLYNYAYSVGYAANNNAGTVTGVEFVGGSGYSKININFGNETSQSANLPTIYNSSTGEYQTVYNYGYSVGWNAGWNRGAMDVWGAVAVGFKWGFLETVNGRDRYYGYAYADVYINDVHYEKRQSGTNYFYLN